MCGLAEHADPHPCEAMRATPRVLRGQAIDSIALAPGDEVVATMLVDNALMGNMVPARPPLLGRLPRAERAAKAIEAVILNHGHLDHAGGRSLRVSS